MNTYPCWLNGRPGYCFEHPRSGWWFIPEQGQGDNEVRRNLSLEDFLFSNHRDRQFEYHRREARQSIPWWQKYLRALFLPKPHSVAGLLLLPAQSL